MMLMVSSIVGSILISVFAYTTLKKMEKAYQVDESKIVQLAVLLPLNLFFTVGAGAYFENMIVTLFYSILIGIMSVLILFDLRHMLLPSVLIYIGSAIALLFRIVLYVISGATFHLVNGILGACVGLALFLVVFYLSKWLFKKEGLGFGDVRLMFFLGMVVGIDGLFLMIILACFIAAIVGGILIVIKGKSEAFPFGPFLCGSALIMMLFGEKLIEIYLKCIS